MERRQEEGEACALAKQCRLAFEFKYMSVFHPVYITVCALSD